MILNQPYRCLEMFLGLGKTLVPPGGPQGPPEGPIEVQKGSLKMLMKYGMLGINFFQFSALKMNTGSRHL